MTLTTTLTLQGMDFGKEETLAFSLSRGGKWLTKVLETLTLTIKGYLYGSFTRLK